MTPNPNDDEDWDAVDDVSSKQISNFAQPISNFTQPMSNLAKPRYAPSPSNEDWEEEVPSSNFTQPMSNLAKPRYAASPSSEDWDEEVPSSNFTQPMNNFAKPRYAASQSNEDWIDKDVPPSNFARPTYVAKRNYAASPIIPDISTDTVTETVPKPSIIYVCGECQGDNEICPKTPIRCLQCGFRILYKKRTKQHLIAYDGR